MAQIITNGVVIGETNQTITITPVYTEGIKIADITINGVTTPLYIPAQQSGGNDDN